MIYLKQIIFFKKGFLKQLFRKFEVGGWTRLSAGKKGEVRRREFLDLDKEPLVGCVGTMTPSV